MTGSDDPDRIGRYRVLRRLGEGGMGRVYLGASPAGRAVAIKVVRPDLAGDPEFRARFRAEAAAARRVSGAFTGPVVDADPDGAVPWLATACVNGLSLKETVDRNGPMPEPLLRALGAGLGEALIAIHAAGLLHRDLKPVNILLAKDGPRVIGFGISRTAEHGASAHGPTQALTSEGRFIGSPGSMSPGADPRRDARRVRRRVRLRGGAGLRRHRSCPVRPGRTGRGHPPGRCTRRPIWTAYRRPCGGWWPAA
ncbi:protein kinase domain-containing protein [Spirillospora sp. CA-108201]